MTGIPIEVVGPYGEYYQALIHAINPSGLVRISLLPATSASLQFDVNFIALRIPPNMKSHDSIPVSNLSIGQDIEVLLENKHNIPSWWPGTITRIRGHFAVVSLYASPSLELERNEISSAPDNHCLLVPLPKDINALEIVELEKIRKRNYNLNLTRDTLFSHLLYFPSGLDRSEARSNFKNIQSLLSQSYNPLLVYLASTSWKLSDFKSNKISIQASSTRRSIFKKTNIIEQTSMPYLNDRITLLKQNKAISRSIEINRREKLLHAFTENFEIQTHLRSRISKSNIETAMELEGVTEINWDEKKGEMKISGFNLTAIKQARNILEFAEEHCVVDRKYLDNIHFKEDYLQDLVNRIGLGSLEILKFSKQPELSKFSFIGTRRSIKDMKVLLNFHFSGLYELETLRTGRIMRNGIEIFK